MRDWKLVASVAACVLIGLGTGAVLSVEHNSQPVAEYHAKLAAAYFYDAVRSDGERRDRLLGMGRDELGRAWNIDPNDGTLAYVFGLYARLDGRTEAAAGFWRIAADTAGTPPPIREAARNYLAAHGEN